MELHYDIVALPKEQWKGTPIPLTTRSDSYYDFELSPLKDAQFLLLGNWQKKRLFTLRRNIISPIHFIRIIGKGQKPMVL